MPSSDKLSARQAAARLLARAPAGRLALLLLLTVLVASSEGVGFLLLVPLLGLLDGGAGAAVTGIEARLLHQLAGAGMPAGAGPLLAGFALLVALRAALQYGRERVATGLQHGLVDSLRQQCFAGLLGSEWRWLAAARRADFANLLLTDVSRIGLGLQFGVALLAGCVAIAVQVAAAFLLSWRLSLAALSGGVLAFALLAGQRRKAMRLGRELGQANRAMQGVVQESLGGIKLAKILGSESRQQAAFARHMQALRRRQREFSASTAWSQALFQAGGAALLAGYVYVGLVVWRMPTPVLLTLVFLFSRLVPLLMAAQQQLHQLLHALPALQEVEQLLGACARHAEPPPPRQQRAWPVQRMIELDKVTISYGNRARPALADLSVQFQARTTTAIIGASGAGKSTLADVLMGLLTPDAGTLRVDGVAVEGALRQAWRGQVAYVPQETFLLHASIRDNLLWACPDADDGALALALRRAAADFVFALPARLDTVVGDGGVLLSGGERQRIGLARALLRKPSLLILDEATSALDVDNEMRVRKAIEGLHGELTVVLIGHRLATLEHADQVLVLDGGRLQSAGSWDDLQTLPIVTS